MPAGTGFGSNVAVTPVGAPSTSNWTGSANPPTRDKVIVTFADSPGLTWIAVGRRAMLKSGRASTVRVTRAVLSNPSPLPRTVSV